MIHYNFIVYIDSHRFSWNSQNINIVFVNFEKFFKSHVHYLMSCVLAYILYKPLYFTYSSALIILHHIVVLMLSLLNTPMTITSDGWIKDGHDTCMINSSHALNVNSLRCVSKPAIIGSDDGLSPVRHQAIIWPNTGILLIRSLGKKTSVKS